ncbi:hypothetical protein ACFE04_013229 [Oxalis oulophora]
MGIEMELDFKKNGKLEMSPNTVLPAPRHRLHTENKYPKGNLTRKDGQLGAKDGFSEINFRRYRSTSCKNVPSSSFGQEGDAEQKRGSVYQSSREVRNIKKMGSRQKIELSRSSASSFSFRVVDSLYSIEEEQPQKSGNLNENAVRKPRAEPCSQPDGFFEINLNLDNRDNQCTSRNSEKRVTFSGTEVASPQNDGNDLLERDSVFMLDKSHSAKVEMTYPSSPSDSDHSSKTNSKQRFTSIRKMLDPFTKSKSLRSPLGYVAEPDDINMSKNRTSRKSLVHDSSHSRQNSDIESEIFKEQERHSVVASSPVHLHGTLKLIKKHGVRFFEFSLNKSPEDTLVARTWKQDGAQKWVYTFHSIDSKRKSNAINDINNESSMVGQMQVSCYLCSELNDGDTSDDSLVTEYVLYDIAHGKQSVSTQEHSKSFADTEKPPTEPSNKPKALPWPSSELNPNLEIAAVVIQVPFEKRESLKYKRGDKVSNTSSRSNLLNLPLVKQSKKYVADNPRNEKVKVILSTGNHSLPDTETDGPSSLLNKWRSGGGCDCGGWDMACPLVVFGNPGINCTEDRPLIDKQRALELFHEGTKDKMPAVSMSVVEEGQYKVDFHAQLSTLQAFSICVSILHGTEASSTAGQEKSIQLTQCNSLKVLIEDEAKLLMDTVVDEKKVEKKRSEMQSSYMINPPFSPIGRA